MTTEAKPKKRNWKKIGLWIGIAVLLIVGTIVTWYLLRDVRNRRILKKEQQQIDLHGHSAYQVPDPGPSKAPNQAVADPVPPADPGTPTTFDKLKVGDKLWALELTTLYKSSNLGPSSALVVCKPGEWVGTVISKSYTQCKVRNYSVKWGSTPQADQTYDFYLPIKSFMVKK